MNFKFKVGDKGKTRGGVLSYLITAVGERYVTARLYVEGETGWTAANYPLSGEWLTGVQCEYDLMYPERAKQEEPEKEEPKKVKGTSESKKLSAFSSKVLQYSREARTAERNIDALKARREVVQAELVALDDLIKKQTNARDTLIGGIRQLITGTDAFGIKVR